MRREKWPTPIPRKTRDQRRAALGCLSAVVLRHRCGGRSIEREASVQTGGGDLSFENAAAAASELVKR